MSRLYNVFEIMTFHKYLKGENRVKTRELETYNAIRDRLLECFAGNAEGLEELKMIPMTEIIDGIESLLKIRANSGVMRFILTMLRDDSIKFTVPEIERLIAVIAGLPQSIGDHSYVAKKVASKVYEYDGVYLSLLEDKFAFLENLLLLKRTQNLRSKLIQEIFIDLLKDESVDLQRLTRSLKAESGMTLYQRIICAKEL